MKVVIALILTVFVNLSIFAQCPNSCCDNGTGKSEKNAEPTVKWYSIEEALALNAKQPKLIVMDVFTDWCGWCKVLDKNTFSHPIIAKYLNDNFYPVKFNAEQTGDVVYMGTTFKNQAKGQRSAHDFVVALTQGKLSYPTIVFFDGQSKPLTMLTGYQSPEQFEPILVFLKEEKHKTQSFEAFLKTFEGKVKPQQQ